MAIDFTSLLHKPHASVVLVTVLGLVGYATGLIGEEPGGPADGGVAVLNTSLPNAAQKNFAPQKYDNAAGGGFPGASRLDSAAVSGSSNYRPQSQVALPRGRARSEYAGVASNGNLSEGDFHRLEGPAQPDGPPLSRQYVAGRAGAQSAGLYQSNRATARQITRPEPLSAEELADRQRVAEHFRQQDDYTRQTDEMLALAQQQLREAPLRVPPDREGYARPTLPSGGLGTSNAGGRIAPSPEGGPLQRDVARVVPATQLAYRIESRPAPRNAFYSLRGEKKNPQVIQAQPFPNAIEAVIHGDAEDVTVTNGSTLRLRLLEEARVGTFVLPRNAILTGVCHIEGERVGVHVRNLRIENTILPVNLTAYDLDGVEGLHVPNLAMKNGVASVGTQALTQGTNVQLPYMVATGGSAGQMMGGQAGAQAVGMAMNGVRQLVARRMSEVKVTIRPNYRVLLRQGQQH
jgi:conjugative transposon TraM protein